MTDKIINKIIKKNIYTKQPPFRYCGHCQIKAITEFFANQDFVSWGGYKNFIDYSPNLLSRWTGFIRPKTILKFLIWSWLDIKKVDKSDYISNIKNKIDNGNIVLMNIWHWYINDKNKFNIINGLLRQHYISVWWYDEGGVYIYDSSVWEDKDIDYDVGNLYISWDIFIKSYHFAVSKMILSIWSKSIKWNQ